MNTFNRHAASFMAADAAVQGLRAAGGPAADIELADTVSHWECMRLWIELARMIRDVSADGVQLRMNLMMTMLAGGYPRSYVDSASRGLMLLLEADDRGEEITLERFERALDTGWA